VRPQPGHELLPDALRRQVQRHDRRHAVPQGRAVHVQHADADLPAGVRFLHRCRRLRRAVHVPLGREDQRVFQEVHLPALVGNLQQRRDLRLARHSGDPVLPAAVRLPLRISDSLRRRLDLHVGHCQLALHGIVLAADFDRRVLVNWRLHVLVGYHHRCLREALRVPLRQLRDLQRRC